MGHNTGILNPSSSSYEEAIEIGKYPGTQLDGLSVGDTIRVNGYVPCLTELYRAYHCSLSTFHHGRSINLAAANAETCISLDIYLMSVRSIHVHLIGACI